MPRADERSIALFSYGTLRQPNVQLAVFGRLLEGCEDSLAGFALAPMTITDPAAIEASGADVHTIASPAARSADPIPGTIFQLTTAELEAADRYEAGPIARIRVRLVSGAEAFVYVASQ